MDNPGDLTTIQRTALVMRWLIADKAKMRTIDVASKTGVTVRQAQRMMRRIEHVVPQICLVDGGFWVFRNGHF